MKAELERYKEAVKGAQAVFRWLQGEVSSGRLLDSVQRAMANIEAILNPPAVYEDVEVARWECPKCGVIFKAEDALFNVDTGCGHCGNEQPWIELTGTYKRPKPQPVERSVSVDCRINSCGDTAGIKTANPFKDHPECHHKRGTLTFTWHEQP